MMADSSALHRKLPMKLTSTTHQTLPHCTAQFPQMSGEATSPTTSIFHLTEARLQSQLDAPETVEQTVLFGLLTSLTALSCKISTPEEKTASIRLISRQVDLTSPLEQLVITMLWTLQAGRQREAKAHLLAQSTQSLGRQVENTLRFAKVTYRIKEVLDCVFSKPMFGATRGRNPLQPHAIHPIFHRTVTRLSLV